MMGAKSLVLNNILFVKMHEIGRATGVEHQVVLTTSAYSARICKEQNLEIKDIKHI